MAGTQHAKIIITKCGIEKDWRWQGARLGIHVCKVLVSPNPPGRIRGLKSISSVALRYRRLFRPDGKPPVHRCSWCTSPTRAGRSEGPHHWPDFQVSRSRVRDDAIQG